MFNILEIVKNDWATYYNFGSGKKSPPIKRTISIIIFSGILALLKHSNQDSFLNAVLSVEAILVGFSFSVMFFLLAEGEPKNWENGSLEISARMRKIDVLSKEIFYNVSYFNLVSIISVLIALILSLPTYGLGPKGAISLAAIYIGLSSEAMTTFKQMEMALTSFSSWLLWTLLYVFLAQSLSTLMRTIGRVHFYFSEKISLDAKK